MKKTLQGNNTRAPGVKGYFLSSIIPFLSVLIFILSFLIFVNQKQSDGLLFAGFFCLLAISVLYSMFNNLSLFWLLLLALPLSIEEPLGIGDSKIILPSELIIIMLAVVFFYRRVFFSGISKGLLRHPLSVVILIYISVLILTTFTSSMPVVSMKFSLVNIAYIIVFYFLLNELVSRDKRHIVSFYGCYAISLVIVIIIALYLHSEYNFRKDISGMVVRPFYSDHTIYSACITLLIPAFGFFSLKGGQLGLSIFKRSAAFIIFIILLTGLLFSYSRGAWIGLAGSAVFLFLIVLGIRFKHLVYLSCLSLAVLYIYKGSIYDGAIHNQAESTDRNNSIAEHIGSSANVSSDVSNLERINRWSCAWRMFKDKPVTGFGPGTYQFAYLPYQKENEMTYISVKSPYNIPFGRGGSAHSEYLLALSESGIMGFLCMVTLFFLALYTGMKVYYNTTDIKIRLLALASLSGLITYFVHGVVNNFLNIDKAASLFWGSLCILVTLDLNRGLNKEKPGQKPAIEK